jgi:alcohol dehydrogenase (NADP+)
MIQLNDGQKMPQIGLGTWQSHGLELRESIRAAIDCGYRHIDCAAIYRNEDQVGEVLKEVIGYFLKREDVFITSKLWNSNHEPKHVEAALVKTLKDLKLEYIDLYLIHWPIAWKQGVDFPISSEQIYSSAEMPMIDTWKELEKLKRSGAVKSIGVSNFSISKIQSLIDNGSIPPSVNQVEAHPYLQQGDLLRFCQSKKIAVTAYSPLGSPVHQENIKSIRLKDDPTILSVAEKYNTTPEDILLRWGVSRGTALIPKSTKPERIRANFKSMVSTLHQEDIQKINSLDKGLRYFTGSDWCAENSPVSLEELWS